MSDINCPYCDLPQEINHDDGQGYSEDELHQQQCSECEKYFTFTTSISFYYEPRKADCLNDGQHDFKPINIFPREFTNMCCSTCDETRKPTPEEMEKILQKDK